MRNLLYKAIIITLTVISILGGLIINLASNIFEEPLKLILGPNYALVIIVGAIAAVIAAVLISQIRTTATVNSQKVGSQVIDEFTRVWAPLQEPLFDELASNKERLNLIRHQITSNRNSGRSPELVSKTRITNTDLTLIANYNHKLGGCLKRYSEAKAALSALLSSGDLHGFWGDKHTVQLTCIHLEDAISQLQTTIQELSLSWKQQSS